MHSQNHCPLAPSQTAQRTSSYSRTVPTTDMYIRQDHKTDFIIHPKDVVSRSGRNSGKITHSSNQKSEEPSHIHCKNLETSIVCIYKKYKVFCHSYCTQTI